MVLMLFPLQVEDQPSEAGEGNDSPGAASTEQALAYFRRRLKESQYVWDYVMYIIIILILMQSRRYVRYYVTHLIIRIKVI